MAGKDATENADSEEIASGIQDRETIHVDPSRNQVFRLIGYIGLLGIFVFLGLEVRTWDDIGDWLMPLGVLTVVYGLILFEIMRISYYLATEAEFSGDYTPAAVITNYSSELIIIGWAGGYPLLLYLFGFRVATPLFLFIFIIYYEKEMKIALVISALFYMFLYILFAIILNMRLWEGVVDVPYL